MKKLILAALAMLASCGVRPAYASLTCDLTLTLSGSRLLANLKLAGIADCPTSGSVTVEWTSPDNWFSSSAYEAHWQSCSREAGTARTRSYRSIQVRDEDGKRHRAVGTWKVKVLAGETVLAESSYEVR